MKYLVLAGRKVLNTGVPIAKEEAQGEGIFINAKMGYIIGIGCRSKLFWQSSNFNIFTLLV